MKFYNQIGAKFSPADKKKLDSLVAPLKVNLAASRAPLSTDDKAAGYSINSTWIYGGTTYTCTDDTTGAAVWIDETSLFYFDTWAQLVAAISVASPPFVGRYAKVANANGGAGSGDTYTAPSAVVNPIVDGGEATYKILAQGVNAFSVKCNVRTITNPVITKIFTTQQALPTAPGYYIFTVYPTQGVMPAGNLNDILYYNGSVWSVYQAYTKATTVLVSNSVSSSTQVTWRKFAGTWMSTADEYIPDKQEYQTGKLWNGKAVYRKCASGITSGAYNSSNNDTGITVPLTGTVILVMSTIVKGGQRYSLTMSEGYACIWVDPSTGKLFFWVNNSAYANTQYVAWVEYTKS